MNGIIIIDKEKGVTSRDVVNEVSKRLKTKKVGHTGTLDPIATGVLVVCVNKATKLVSRITDEYKEYVASCLFGISTDTIYIEGKVLKDIKSIISKEDIINTLNSFKGKYRQQVPIYSAVKINGKKLYEYARENIDIKLPSRNVNIYSLELLEFNNDVIKFKTKVSKGTYIRSLIEDICTMLNVYGTMNTLQRTKQGKFDIKDSILLEDINEDTDLLNAFDVLDISNYILDDNLYRLVSNGNKLKLELEDGYYNLSYKNNNIAIYKFEYNEGRLVMFY